MKNKLTGKIHRSIILSWLSILYVSLHPHQLLAQSSAKPTVQQLDNPKITDTEDVQNRYIRAANNKILDYLKKYPNLKVHPTKSLLEEYPIGTSCPKIKQPPFIILLLVVSEVVGDSTYMLRTAFSPYPDRTSIDKTSGASIDRTLMQIATSSGFREAIETDTKRPAAASRPVLYTLNGHNLSFVKMLKAECEQGIKLFFMLQMSII